MGSKARAQKRGGGQVPISLDLPSIDSSPGIEPASGLTAEQFYDQQWAIPARGRNLPIIHVGGYRHSSYAPHDAKHNTPFANVFVLLTQRVGRQIDRIGSRTAESFGGLVSA